MRFPSLHGRYVFPLALSFVAASAACSSSTSSDGDPDPRTTTSPEAPTASAPVPTTTPPAPTPPAPTTPAPAATPGQVDPSCLSGGYLELDRSVELVTGGGASATAYTSGGERVVVTNGQPEPSTSFQGDLVNLSSDVAPLAGGKLAVVRTDGSTLIVDAQTGSSVTTIMPTSLAIIPQVAAAANGFVYLAGYGRGARSGSAFLVQRIASGGSVDTSFGDGGVAAADVAATFGSSATGRVTGLSVGTGGEVWLRGVRPSSNAFVVKLSPSGTTDKSFGSSGLLDLTQLEFAAAVLPTGGGVTISGVTKTKALQVSRRTASGALDAAFGSGGTTTVDLAGAGETFAHRDLLLQPDGKILAVGATLKGNLGQRIAVVRMTATGQLDTSFGTQGVARVSVGATSALSETGRGRSAVVLDGSRLLVGGTRLTPSGGNAYRNDGGLVCLAL